MNKINPDVKGAIVLPKYKYPSAPKKNPELRNKDPIVVLSTNLFKLIIRCNDQKLSIYNVTINPELASDNFTLRAKIYRQIEPELSNTFVRKSFYVNNFFATSANPPEILTIKTKVEDIEYIVNLKFLREMDLSQVNDLNGDNQQIKAFFERLIKNILLKNRNTIKLGNSRVIVKINLNNVFDIGNSKTTVYKGYLTSGHITDNGLLLSAQSVNKYLKNITVLDKIKELKDENKDSSPSEIRKIIDDYFKIENSVIATYGSYRTYRIGSFNFDTNPKKACFNFKDGEIIKTITVEDYYKIQYNIKIQDLEQPLIIAAKREKQEKDKADQEEKIIYLVPELVYITENTADKRDIKAKKFVNKSKVDPNSKMKEICSIKDLFNSNSGKAFKKGNGENVQIKSPKQFAEEWGITLGDNLSVEGRILPPPHLLYGRDQKVVPKNGRYQSGKTLKGVSFNNNNFIYVYDVKDKSDIKVNLHNLKDKAIKKEIKVDLDIEKIKSIPIKDSSKLELIYHSLKGFKNYDNIEMAIVFLSPQLEKYYSELKSFFTNEAKFPTQFVISKKLQDPKNAGSIMFNIVEQINMKMGGTNFYIDFYKEKILAPNKIYMIIGLESRETSKGIIDYVMTSSVNQNLNRIVTSIESAKNIQEEKEKAIEKLLRLSLEGIKNSGAMHPPDYIILYRQGGNEVQNKKIAGEEVPIFTNYLKHSFPNYKIKFVYICCNLRSNLKFFEKRENSYANPQSGVCVDSGVTQKDKYEFYIQPQWVNQGTATPCHYHVLYEDIDEKDQENRLKLEQLQLLGHYLSFYYWTWSGAIRVPANLKLANTALDFFTNHLNRRLEKENKQFKNPEYI